MHAVEFQPIRVRTGSEDKEGRLALLDGELIAILVRLDDEVHDSERGKWFVEAQFGPPRRVEPFGTLDDAEAWLRAQIAPPATPRPEPRQARA
ncbi:MAG TPA: hypothetical protein VGN97_20005 [Mesorhizobium sp.]|nr:hypothetical protein [Mesorhizobium sp.]